MVIQLFRIFNGPNLFKIYKDSSREGVVYSSNQLETCGNNIIRTISAACSVTIYASPIIILYLSRTGYCCAEGISSLLKFAGAVGLIFLGSFFLRGVGRFANSDYRHFLLVLDEAQKNFSKENKLSLAKYDFEFSAWPVEYTFSENLKNKKGIADIQPRTSRRSTLVEKVKALPCKLLSYIAVHTIGKRMVYPGTVSLIQLLTSSMALEGRSKLVEKFKGQRYKLKTKEGNEVDSMLIDRRNTTTSGEYLIICCEGNAGFYEYGLMFTPLERGYSVLGWNHPGFGGSTGSPFPDQEQSSIDTIMQFAINELGFPTEKIVLFAWSIGGYTASWAAMMYPNIKGLILDATFDDILPLAIARMPVSWKPLIVRTIRDYLNLVIVDQVLNYPGPILLYRRTSDEVISTNDAAPLQTNRGNELLVKMLQHRYPNIFDPDSIKLVRDWLHGNNAQKTLLWNSRNIEDRSCEMVISAYINEHSAGYPMAIGDAVTSSLKEELALYLVSKYLEDFDATHCIPLPSNRFHLPWNSSDIHHLHKD